MIYNHRVLTEEEKVTVYALLDHYKNYDKLDIIIEMAVDDPSAVLKRKSKSNVKENETTQSMPEDIKFCDGDRCSIF